MKLLSNGSGKYYLPAKTREEYCENYWYYVESTSFEKQMIDKTKRSNPAPKDGITLRQLLKNPLYKKKIIDLYISVNCMKNKSCIFCLYGLGYAFTWPELRVLGRFFLGQQQ